MHASVAYAHRLKLEREISLKGWWPKKDKQKRQPKFSAEKYKFDPAGYIREKLGWEPWTGNDGIPGQQQILDAYVLALRQLHERDAFEKGQTEESKLQYWIPGEIIQNVIRIEAGHTVGKTKILSGLVNHFFDCFVPAVGYCFAPSQHQIHDLLFKEIKTDRRGKGLPGEILDLEIRSADDHFIKGKATNNDHGQGTERAQGQHGKYNLYVLDEAEGVADFVFNAIRSMTSGGISIVLLAANPRTRSSRFHKIAAEPHVKSFRMSCLGHPNVVAGKEIVPGAVRRQYVDEMIDAECDAVDKHNADDYTFSVDWRPEKIYQPRSEFLFRVLGIAPANISDKTLIPSGRYEAACKRVPSDDRPHFASMGVDCARWGLDKGTLYTRHNGRIWRDGAIGKLDQVEYYLFVKKRALALKEKGVTHLHIRVDAGGGFGAGLIDLLKRDDELIQAFPEFKVFEVNFGGSPKDDKAFYDWITEATADVAETLKGISIINPPESLEADLCERECEPRNREGRFVKKLVEKDKFRKEHGRSPDDGDGFVLACVSEFLVDTNPELHWA